MNNVLLSAIALANIVYATAATISLESIPDREKLVTVPAKQMTGDYLAIIQ